MHDVSHVTATHLPELEARKADLLERRSRVTAAATEAGAQLSAAQQKLADVAKAFAADTSDLKAGSAAQNAIRTAESAVAVTQEALKHLSAEDAQLEAELKAAGIPVTLIKKPLKIDPFALWRLARFLKQKKAK